MKRLFLLLTMATLVMLAMAVPAFACDDCRDGPGIVAGYDIDGSHIDVAATTVKNDTILPAQSERCGVFVVTHDTAEAPVFAPAPRARDVPRFMFSGLHVATVSDTNQSGLMIEGAFIVHTKGSSLFRQGVIA